MYKTLIISIIISIMLGGTGIALQIEVCTPTTVTPPTPEPPIPAPPDFDLELPVPAPPDLDLEPLVPAPSNLNLEPPVPPTIPDDSPLPMIKYYRQNLKCQNHFGSDMIFTTYNCGEIFKQFGKLIIMNNINKFSYTNYVIHKNYVFVVPEPIDSDINFEY